MKKNKIIGLVIWLLTLVLPMKSLINNDFGSGFYYLLMFLFTLIGAFVGSYFFSKSTDNGVA